jgi:hypothetical protein
VTDGNETRFANGREDREPWNSPAGRRLLLGISAIGAVVVLVIVLVVMSPGSPSSTTDSASSATTTSSPSASTATTLPAGLGPAETAYVQQAVANGDDIPSLGSLGDLVTFGDTLCLQSKQGLIGTDLQSDASQNNVTFSEQTAEMGSQTGLGKTPRTNDLMELAAKYICPQYAADIQHEIVSDSGYTQDFCGNVQTLAEPGGSYGGFKDQNQVDQAITQMTQDANTVGPPFSADWQAVYNLIAQSDLATLMATLEQDCASYGNPATP